MKVDIKELVPYKGIYRGVKNVGRREKGMIIEGVITQIETHPPTVIIRDIENFSHSVDPLTVELIQIG